MRTGDKARRLRIYISSTDKYDHKPLYEAIVYLAKKMGISGATVLKGIMGYGASSEIYSDRLWEISEKIPLVLEFIDDQNKIESFTEAIKPIMEKSGKGHMITSDTTDIILHKSGIKK